jgi:hypothetical protein
MSEFHNRATLLQWHFSPVNRDEPSEQDPTPRATSPKRRRPASRRITVTAEMLRSEFGVLPIPENMRKEEVSLFSSFSCKLVEVGHLVWRVRSDDFDVFVMNDYSADGDLLPCAFVHVERRCTDMDSTFSCSCRSALLLQTCAQNSATMVEEVVPEGIMCMHCRFLKDNFNAMIEVLRGRHQVDSHLKRCVRRSQKLLQQGVVPLETGGASLRFSVRSSVGENLSFVSITDGFIKCHKGECQVRLHSRKSVRKLLSLDEASEACPHLEAMRAQQEVWVDCLPQLEQASGDRMGNLNDQGIMAQVGFTC